MIGERNKSSEMLITVFSVVSVLVVWQIITFALQISPLVLPSPAKVWQSFVEVLTTGYGANQYSLLTHLISSMNRLLLAFLLVVISAIPLGLICACFPKVYAIFNPFIEFYRPVPPLAYYTILVLWLGIGESSKITMLYLAGFAPVYLACISGVKKIKREQILAAKMLGANNKQLFINVILPASLPEIFTGLRTAIGFEYTTLVAAEMVAAQTGIGWLVLDASNWLKSGIVFFGVILMGLIGIFLNYLLLVLEKKLVHWQGK